MAPKAVKAPKPAERASKIGPKKASRSNHSRAPAKPRLVWVVLHASILNEENVADEYDDFSTTIVGIFTSQKAAQKEAEGRIHCIAMDHDLKAEKDSDDDDSDAESLESFEKMAPIPRPLTKYDRWKRPHWSTSGTGDEVWIEWHTIESGKGIKLKEEFKHIPDPPGYQSLNPIDTKAWENIPTEHVNYAFKLALREYLDSWKFVFNSNFRSRLREEERIRERKAAGLEDDSLPEDTSAQGASVQIPNITKEDVREGAIHVAKRLKEAATDEDLRAKLTALGTTALRTARDGLDNFLLGYTEGKHEEIRAWLEEEQGKEQETKERVKRVRQMVEAELAHRRAMDASAAVSAQGTGSSSGTASPLAQEGKEQDPDAKMTAAAAAALQSVASDPAVQTLKDMFGAIKSVVVEAPSQPIQPARDPGSAQDANVKDATAAPTAPMPVEKGK